MISEVKKLYQEWQERYEGYDRNHRFGLRRRIVNLARRMKLTDEGAELLQEMAAALGLELEFRDQAGIDQAGIAPESPTPKMAPIWRVQLVREPGSPASSQVQIGSKEDAAAVLRPYLEHLDREHFVVMLLNTKNRLLGLNTVAVGTVNSALVSAAETFKPALLANATVVIVGHNHPSGDPSPSPEDISVTRTLVEAGKILGVEVLDHIIIGEERYISLKERGLM